MLHEERYQWNRVGQYCCFETYVHTASRKKCVFPSKRVVCFKDRDPKTSLGAAIAIAGPRILLSTIHSICDHESNAASGRTNLLLWTSRMDTVYIH